MNRNTSEKLAVEVINRRTLLESISANEPAPATDLEPAVESSVSTINRVVSEFERENIIQRTSEGISLTVAGEFLLAEMEQFVDTVETTRYLQPLLSSLEEAPFEFEKSWIHVSNVTTTTPSDPYAPLSRYSELFSNAAKKRLVGHRFTVPEQGVKAAMREIDNSVHCTCVWSAAALERMAEQFPDMVEWAAQRENLTARVADDISVDLALFDDHLLVYGFDSTGALSILIDSTDAAVFEWGERVFDAVFHDATTISNGVENIT